MVHGQHQTQQIRMVNLTRISLLQTRETTLFSVSMVCFLFRVLFAVGCTRASDGLESYHSHHSYVKP